jgi:deoxycytidylate deaminase
MYKKKVAAVLVKDGRIISIGYNGLPSGYTIKKLETCKLCNGKGILDKENLKIPLSDVYGFSIPDKNEILCYECGGTGKKEIREDKCECNNKTIPEVVHAEANAILFCTKNGISTNGATLYVTLSPCFECAKMIIQAGIKRVVYKEKYRDTKSLDFLKECGIIVEQYKI